MSVNVLESNTVPVALSSAGDGSAAAEVLSRVAAWALFCCRSPTTASPTSTAIERHTVLFARSPALLC